MFGLAARLLGGAIAPLTDKLAEFSARLLRKLALFLVAGVSMIVVLIALTIAFDLWVANHAGPIAGALSVAGLYSLVAVVAVVFALRDGSKKPGRAAESKARTDQSNDEGETAAAGLNEHIDRFVAPLIGVLQQLGLKRERLAVLAGASVAKKLGPIPLVGLAIVAGFLIGRMWKSWRGLLSIDAIAALLNSSLFGLRADRYAGEDPETEDGR